MSSSPEPPDLAELRVLSDADVYKGGTHAGRLVRRTDRVEFVYDPDYVAAGGEPVATTLPTSNPSFEAPAGAVPPYFAGLLPEGRRLAAIRERVGTSADDEFSILLAVGADTVGDVQVVPAGHPPELPSLGEVPDIGDTSFVDLFARAIGVEPERVALAGVQDKISGRMISVPLHHRRHAILLKLDPPEFPHLVENEAFFLAVARASGLRTVDVEVVHDRDGRPGLLVVRFDRILVADVPRSLPVEDGCQVMGRWPADKYRMETSEVIGALAEQCGAPRVAAHEMFRQLVFAYLAGDGDLHAKNLAIVRGEGGEWRPSPAYDLPSSAPYGDTDLALPIGGRVRSTISCRQLVELGAQVGLPERAVLATLREQVDHADEWGERLDELPLDQHRLATLTKLTRHRREQLRAEIRPDVR